jgi:NAD(P)-dependent dehydrogenase (short-subunit alcohol dehydrogenase family)
MTDPHRLDERTAVVMGAGSIGEGWGNGKASAVTYARYGASVVCVDRRLAAAAETAAFIEQEGGRALALEADATAEADVRAVVDRAVATFGRLDIMHNNVGVGGSGGLPDQVAPDDWAREIDQNLTTAYLGIRCAVPALRANGGGVITNTSSTFAVRWLRRMSAGYTTGKAAVEALTRVCAVGYGRDNIRVNCIRIGFSETPLVMAGLAARRLDAERQEAEMAKSRAKVPLRGEHGDAFDVAETAAFLASDAAKYLSGLVVSVDGALELAPL